MSRSRRAPCRRWKRTSPSAPAATSRRARFGRAVTYGASLTASRIAIASRTARTATSARASTPAASSSGSPTSCTFSSSASAPAISAARAKAVGAAPPAQFRLAITGTPAALRARRTSRSASPGPRLYASRSTARRCDARASSTANSAVSSTSSASASCSWNTLGRTIAPTPARPSCSSAARLPVTGEAEATTGERRLEAEVRGREVDGHVARMRPRTDRTHPYFPGGRGAFAAGSDTQLHGACIAPGADRTRRAALVGAPLHRAERRAVRRPRARRDRVDRRGSRAPGASSRSDRRSSRARRAPARRRPGRSGRPRPG